MACLAVWNAFLNVKSAALRKPDMACSHLRFCLLVLQRHASVVLGNGSFTAALHRVGQILGPPEPTTPEASAPSASDAIRLRLTGRVGSVIRQKAVTGMSRQLRTVRKQVSCISTWWLGKLPTHCHTDTKAGVVLLPAACFVV